MRARRRQAHARPHPSAVPTPPRAFDREDVFGLAAALDDVIDFAEEVADYLVSKAAHILEGIALKVGTRLAPLA